MINDFNGGRAASFLLVKTSGATSTPKMNTPAFLRNIVPQRPPPPVHIPGSLSTVLYSTIPITILFYGFWDQYSDYLQSQSLTAYRTDIVEEYDFIIGGGSAGSVLANRLSENANYTVLLLEGGGNMNPMQQVPLYFSRVLHTPQIDYNYYTVPQVNSCMAMNEQRSYWPRGVGLGGSSNLNAMYYQRGNKNDYDRWAELSADDKWKFENVLRNFKNIEDYHGGYPDEEWHSTSGKGVYVSASTEKRLLKEFLAAGTEMGYPTKDVNGFQEASFSTLDLTIKNGRRYSAYNAFLEPILSRKNLTIYRYSRVLQIQFAEGLTASGVSYLRHGVRHFVKARKEVILSAGAIDSPKLLMKSGIGPKGHLEQMGIKCLVNLPVGQNLMDHIMIQFPFTLKSHNKTFNYDRDLYIETITDYVKSHNGLLATSMTANGVAYIYSDTALRKMEETDSSPENVSPDLQLIFLPTAPTGLYSFLERSWNLRRDLLKNYYGTAGKEEDGLLVNVMLSKPKSRGEIKLARGRRRSELEAVFNPRYFREEEDLRRMVEGMNWTVTMVENTEAFRKHGARLVDKPLPGCEGFVVRSWEYYECYARHMTLTVYHQSGTATMGKGEDDPKAVVDSNLRVLKTKGLRVVDASIIPEIPNSNLNAAVFMIADKAGEIILEHWQGKEDTRGKSRQ